MQRSTKSFSLRFITSLLLSLLALSYLSAQNLELSFASDTVYLCSGDSVELSPQVSGGQAPYQFQWSTGDTSASLIVSPTLGDTMISLQVVDALNATVGDSVNLIVLAECVWPGDTEGNGSASNTDILTLASSMGMVGPTRPEAHTNWIGQPAPAWNQSVNGGADFVHSDTDGNGVVEVEDIEAIRKNYFQPQATSGLSSNSANGIPFYIDWPTGTWLPGDTIVAPIILGTNTMPANDILGIAFSISYNSALVDSGSVQINYQGSWLGQIGQNLASLDHDFYQYAQVDVGIIRTDHLGESGYGRVADIIVAIDDITGKTDDIKTLEIAFTKVSLMNQVGGSLPINTEINPFVISLGNEDNRPLPDINIYPNPAQSFVRLEWEEIINRNNSYWELLSPEGKSVLYQESRSLTDNQLDLSSLSEGIYFLRFKNDEYFIQKKLVIKR